VFLLLLLFMTVWTSFRIIIIALYCQHSWRNYVKRQKWCYQKNTAMQLLCQYFLKFEQDGCLLWNNMKLYRYLWFGILCVTKCVEPIHQQKHTILYCVITFCNLVQHLMILPIAQRFFICFFKYSSCLNALHVYVLNTLMLFYF